MNNFTQKLDFLTFSPIDYSMFVMILVISVAIGIYFGFYKKQITVADYLLGGKNMAVLPVAISLAASYTSAITLLGMPAEIYTYGTRYVLSCFAAFLTSFIISKVYLPVFYDLQLTSSFEYLALRFNDKVRMTVSFISLCGFMLYLPLVMYVPSLAFNLVTGINIKLTAIVVGFICIFYTAIGGLKAVVWTDTIQYLLMNGSILLILILGIPNEGGIQNIWKNALEGDRIEFFDFDPSFYKRMTVWSITFGMSVIWTSTMGVNQMCIQRFLSLSSLANAQKVLFIFCGFVVIMKSLSLSSGLIIYSRYGGCDPLMTGKISNFDQILPYYVMDTARNVPGLPGIFIAGIFSASLSSMSTFLNTACGVVYKDFLVRWLPSNTSELTASRIMKLLVVLIGSFCMVIVFYMEKFGSIVELAISFDGVTSGPILGTFTLGMLYHKANEKGTIIGAFTSLLFMVSLLYGSKSTALKNNLKYPMKSFSIDECENNTSVSNYYNSTLYRNPENADDIFFLFRISILWYSLMGFIITLAIGILISAFTNPPSSNQTKLEYFSPVVRKYLPKYINNDIKVDENIELMKKTTSDN